MPSQSRLPSATEVRSSRSYGLSVVRRDQVERAGQAGRVQPRRQQPVRPDRRGRVLRARSQAPARRCPAACARSRPGEQAIHGRVDGRAVDAVSRISARSRAATPLEQADRGRGVGRDPVDDRQRRPAPRRGGRRPASAARRRSPLGASDASRAASARRSARCSAVSPGSSTASGAGAPGRAAVARRDRALDEAASGDDGAVRGRDRLERPHRLAPADAPRRRARPRSRGAG